jgi:hypothetical protein
MNVKKQYEFLPCTMAFFYMLLDFNRFRAVQQVPVSMAPTLTSQSEGNSSFRIAVSELCPSFSILKEHIISVFK